MCSKWKPANRWVEYGSPTPSDGGRGLTFAAGYIASSTTCNREASPLRLNRGRCFYSDFGISTPVTLSSYRQPYRGRWDSGGLSIPAKRFN